MIPVYQTMTVANDGAGNCFNACVASIMELPLRDVCSVLPSFEGNYWAEWNSWAARHGVEINHRPLGDTPPKGFAIAAGYGGRSYPEGHELSGRPIRHAAVVFNGELIHDPFPGAKKFEGIEYYWTIDPITESQRAYKAAHRQSAA